MRAKIYRKAKQFTDNKKKSSKKRIKKLITFITTSFHTAGKQKEKNRSNI